MHILTVATLIVLIGSLTTASALQLPEKIKSHAKKLRNICQREIGVADDLIRSASSGKIPDSPEMKCYLYCLFDKVGLINDDHVIHLENLLELLPENLHPIVQNLVDKCGTKHGVDGCDTAYLTVQCYADTDPELFSSGFGMD